MTRSRSAEWAGRNWQNVIPLNTHLVLGQLVPLCLGGTANGNNTPRSRHLHHDRNVRKRIACTVRVHCWMTLFETVESVRDVGQRVLVVVFFWPHLSGLEPTAPGHGRRTRWHKPHFHSHSLAINGRAADAHWIICLHIYAGVCCITRAVIMDTRLYISWICKGPVSNLPRSYWNFTEYFTIADRIHRLLTGNHLFCVNREKCITHKVLFANRGL